MAKARNKRSAGVLARLPIALQVDDVEQARARLEAADVAFHMDTIDSGVCHQAFSSDPDGNTLALHHRYAPPKSKPSDL